MAVCLLFISALNPQAKWTHPTPLRTPKNYPRGPPRSPPMEPMEDPPRGNRGDSLQPPPTFDAGRRPPLFPQTAPWEDTPLGPSGGFPAVPWGFPRITGRGCIIILNQNPQHVPGNKHGCIILDPSLLIGLNLKEAVLEFLLKVRFHKNPFFHVCPSRHLVIVHDADVSTRGPRFQSTK